MTSISPHWSSSTNSEVVTLPCQLSLGYCFCGYDSTNNEKHHNRHSVTKRPYCIEFNCSLRSMTWTFSYLNYGNNMRKCMNESNSKIVAYATTMTRQVVSYSIVVTDSRSEFHICLQHTAIFNYEETYTHCAPYFTESYFSPLSYLFLLILECKTHWPCAVFLRPETT